MLFDVLIPNVWRYPVDPTLLQLNQVLSAELAQLVWASYKLAEALVETNRRRANAEAQLARSNGKARSPVKRPEVVQ